MSRHLLSDRAVALRARLDRARLYLCTDARERQGDLPEFLDAALAGGVDIVQLRQKGLEARQEMEYLRVFRAACERHGALLAVNDRADIAHAVQADVLHLGQDDLPVPAARAIVGEDILIGRSTPAGELAAAAAGEPGTDYFCAGPVWPTPTKPGRAAPGVELLRYAAAQRQGRPWFAIGGIDEGNLDEVLAAGARRIVVVRAITEAADPRAAARSLARRLRDAS
ncbi:thiamine phosphate synthase [Spirillospora sp. NPDC029432]|uniref:thiamine phosphate synthase n=1 Tax=Spirillospora sp. NPDC029432 TaxID=3154599 RepID=UPI0034567849